jgi:hypothetical protein
MPTIGLLLGKSSPILGYLDRTFVKIAI